MVRNYVKTFVAGLFALSAMPANAVSFILTRPAHGEPAHFGIRTAGTVGRQS
jgi:hypothetical protein